MTQVWLVTGSSRGLGRAIVEAGLAAGNRASAHIQRTASSATTASALFRGATSSKAHSSLFPRRVSRALAENDQSATYSPIASLMLLAASERGPPRTHILAIRARRRCSFYRASV